MQQIETFSSNQCVSWWLMASFVYYELGDSILSDEQFDELTLRITNEWQFIDHPHKYLITDSHLEAGSGYDIEYPKIVQYSAMDILYPISLINTQEQQ